MLIPLLLAAACSADPVGGPRSPREMQAAHPPPAPAQHTPSVTPPPGPVPTGGTGARPATVPPRAIDAGPHDAAPPTNPPEDPPPPLCSDEDAGLDPDAMPGDCVAVGDLRAQYRAGDTDAADNQVKPQFNLVNDGAQAVPLTELTLRYWYTTDAPSIELFSCDYAKLGCGSVQGRFVDAQRQGADRYLEISFTSGALAAGAETGEIQARFNHDDWVDYDESDDYSFAAGQTSFADAPKVTVYRRDVLVWGREPAP